MAITTNSSDDGSRIVDNHCHVGGTFVIDTDVLDTTLRHLTELYSEYKVLVNSHGWHIKVVNSSNTAMANVRIHESEFEEYDVQQQGVMGVSHDALERTRDFVDDGAMHLTVDAETRMMTVTDESERMFYDVALIDPTSISDRHFDAELEPETSVTVDSGQNASRSSSSADQNRNDSGSDGDMFEFKKFIREHSGNKNAVFDVTEQNTVVKMLDRSNDVVDTFTFEDGGEPTEVSVGPSYLYSALKKPLKSQLNGTPYTFTFHGDDMPMTISRRIGDSEREFDDSPELLSYISLTIAPNMSHDMD